MAAFPNSTIAFKSHSRRSVLTGLAAALAGASVPVAAVAGLTARRFTGDDTKLLAQCSGWHDRRRRLKRLEKACERLYRAAAAKMPPKPSELFEPIQLFEHCVRYPLEVADHRYDGSWERVQLERYARTTVTTPGCQAHCRKLMSLFDEHEATRTEIFAEYDRLDQISARENAKSWRLFIRIIRTRATTLQGAAAQLKVTELAGVLAHSHSEGMDAQVIGVVRNTRRLIAAQQDLRAVS